MDIHNLKSCIDHDEATIQSYMRDPEFAQYMLQETLAEGDTHEAEKIQRRINEATRRRQSAIYWDGLITHAEETAQSGYNLEQTLALLNEAITIIKRAIPVTA